MPATIEALLIILVFVMPGFITVRMKETLVPTIGKTETFEVTLRSITVSLLYLPLWLLSAKDLVLFRGRLMDVAQKTSSGESLILDRGVVVFLALSLVLPAAIGVIWAVAYCNDWYVKATKRAYVKLGIPLPPSGIGEDLWDRLWLNRDRQPWLTVFMKDGRMYVGRGGLALDDPLGEAAADGGRRLERGARVAQHAVEAGHRGDLIDDRPPVGAHHDHAGPAAAHGGVGEDGQPGRQLLPTAREVVRIHALVEALGVGVAHAQLGAGQRRR